MHLTKRLLVVTLLGYSMVAFSQGTRVDSLKNVLVNAKGRERFKAHSMLSDEYSNNDLDKAMLYARKSLSDAQQLENDTMKALACNSIANVFQYKSELDSSLFYHRKALGFRRQLGDDIGVGDSYNNIGIAYDTKGLYEEALKHYFKALAIYERRRNEEKMAMTYTNIGIIYKTQKEYRKALDYYRKSYQLYRKNHLEAETTIAAGNLGSILINFRKWKESLYYSDLAIEGYRKLGFDRYIAYPMTNKAVVFDSLHQFVEANKVYEASIALHQHHQNWFEVANTLNCYANCLNKQRRFRESVTISQQAFDAAIKADALAMKVEAERNLAKAYTGLGDFRSAIDHANRYAAGKDSLFVTEKTKAIFEMEARYENVKKEKQILQQEAEAKRRNTMLLIFGIIALASILIGFLIYRQQRLRNRQQQQEFELKSAIAQIETQNKLQDQRLSISRDLHDNIGAQLTFIISSVDNLKYAFDFANTKLDEKLRTISEFTQSTIIELRDTIWAMNSHAISIQDLKLRITNFIDKARSVAGQTQFSFVTDAGLDGLVFGSVAGMNLYRVIQESVNNSLKYANADKIRVEVRDEGSFLVIRIADNGIGFDEKTVRKGNGLSNMRKRLKEIGGKLEIVSAPDKGTSVIVSVDKNTLNQSPAP